MLVLIELLECHDTEIGVGIDFINFEVLDHAPIRAVATLAWPNRQRAGPPASLSDHANVKVSLKACMIQFSLPSPNVFSGKYFNSIQFIYLSLNHTYMQIIIKMQRIPAKGL